ncbi:MAG: hypothetical protein HONBIEJF_01953 [Fimbriimonadaceae bacterium]|nr:hypothetical protein [Fimbriimonadaceae bacterium]
MVSTKLMFLALVVTASVGAGCTIEDDDPDTIVNPPSKVEVNTPNPPPKVDVKIDDQTGGSSTTTTG